MYIPSPTLLGEDTPILLSSPSCGKVESLSCSLVITPATILTFPFFLLFRLFFFFSLIDILWSATLWGQSPYLWFRAQQ